MMHGLLLGFQGLHGDLSCEVGQVWDNEGYLILIIALDSIYLNLYDDIANGLSEGVSQACAKLTHPCL